MRMMRFMGDRLGGGQPADQENADDEKSGEALFYLQMSHRRVVHKENLMANATGVRRTESRLSGCTTPCLPDRVREKFAVYFLDILESHALVTGTRHDYTTAQSDLREQERSGN